METPDSNTPDDATRRQLKGRLWGLANTEAVATIQDCEKAAKAAAKAAVEESKAAVTAIKTAIQAAVEESKAAVIGAGEAAKRSSSAVANIADALDEALAAIRAATSKSMEDAAEVVKSRMIAVMDIEVAAQTQINKIEQLVNDRLSQYSIPPPDLAPIDLDKTYSEKDFAVALDSVTWVAFEYRRVKVRHGLGYRVDYSRASRKPPTTLAMAMVEYYVAYPEKLDRLFQRVTRPSGTAAEKPTRPENRPKTKDELDAEAYLRSVGLLPPEGETCHDANATQQTASAHTAATNGRRDVMLS